MHCMAWLHEEPVYQLLVLLLLQTHLETVILDIFSWMDFNVFYCNLVNILIHFFFPITGLLDESYLLGDWEGRGTGIHHLSPWQYSSLTVSTWWPTQLENLRPCITASATKTKTCKWDCGRTENWLHSGTAFEKGELTDSSKPTLPQLSFPLHVNSWVWDWCFNTPIFCLELWWNLKHQCHFCLLSFCSGQWWLGSKWRHAELKLEQMSLCYWGRASGSETQMALLVTEIWHPGAFLTVTAKITSVWGSGCHQYCVTPSTVQQSQIRWGSPTLFRQNPDCFFEETVQDNSTFILKGYPLFKCVEIFVICT